MVMELMTGTRAIALAVKFADVDVISAYPIRPYTGVMNELARMIADGELDAEYIVSDSEHTQFEIAKHAACCGARVFTGSAGIGFAYAHEPIVVTPGDRAPVVAMVGNRALDDPGNFGVEHNDVLVERDLGWMMCWPETPQEAFDLVLIAYKVCEDPRVLLPMAVNCDGNFITHVRFPVEIPDDIEAIKKFVPPKPPERINVLHPDKPVSIAPHVDYWWGAEIRRQMDQAMKEAKEVIKAAHEEYNKLFDGRGGPPFIEEYMTEDAEIALLGMGGMCMPIRAGVREMRKEGVKVGLVKLRRFRPFPFEELQEVLKKFSVVAVMDNNFSLGSPYYGGVVWQEVRSTLFDMPDRPIVLDFLVGLGGREITLDTVKNVIKIAKKVAETKKPEKLVYWMDVRGE